MLPAFSPIPSSRTSGRGIALAPAILNSALLRPFPTFTSLTSFTSKSRPSAASALGVAARLRARPSRRARAAPRPRPSRPSRPSAQQQPLRQQGRSRAATSSGCIPTPCGTTSRTAVVRPVRGRMVEPRRLCKELCRTLLAKRLWQLWPNKSKMLMQDASPICAQVPWSYWTGSWQHCGTGWLPRIFFCHAMSKSLRPKSKVLLTSAQQI